jgi:hypothetical protein
MKVNRAFAEVIESSLHTWKAQSWQWDRFARFGSLVTINTPERTIFGIVHNIETGSLDPVRTPFPFQKTEEELLREQPQIFAFLQTTFTCLTAAYQENSILLYQWAPEPPKIHAFVSEATQQQYELFFSDEQYIHILFGLSHQILNLDELLLAMFKNLSDQKLLDQRRLSNIIETFSLLTGNDYRRLKLFLQRVTPCITLQSTPRQ